MRRLPKGDCVLKINSRRRSAPLNGPKPKRFKHLLTSFSRPIPDVLLISRMKQRLYLDTSVFGGYFDDEFAEFTIPLFERLDKGEFILLFSTVTQDELANAPQKVRDLVTGIKTEFTEFLKVEGKSVDLATNYIAERVVGPTSYADCLHIALATIAEADYLISDRRPAGISSTS